MAGVHQESAKRKPPKQGGVSAGRAYFGIVIPRIERQQNRRCAQGTLTSPAGLPDPTSLSPRSLLMRIQFSMLMMLQQLKRLPAVSNVEFGLDPHATKLVPRAALLSTRRSGLASESAELPDLSRLRRRRLGGTLFCLRHESIVNCDSHAQLRGGVFKLCDALQ